MHVLTIKINTEQFMDNVNIASSPPEQTRRLWFQLTSSDDDGSKVLPEHVEEYNSEI
jgi:hypothetical protein